MNNLNIMTTRDLAKMFHVSRMTITKWLRKVDGFPTPRKIGLSFYWDADEVRDFWERKGAADAKIYQPK